MLSQFSVFRLSGSRSGRSVPCLLSQPVSPDRDRTPHGSSLELAVRLILRLVGTDEFMQLSIGREFWIDPLTFPLSGRRNTVSQTLVQERTSSPD